MIELYQIDAFATNLFAGNPAAVVPLPFWPDDSILQSIATENNLAETSFLVKTGGVWELRWFTPIAEVALCGHATLAAAFVVFKHLEKDTSAVDFHTRESGVLSVTLKTDDQLAMSFPSIPVRAFDEVTAVTKALGAAPGSVWRGDYSADQFDVLAVFDSESDVQNLVPNFPAFADIPSRGIIATAPGVQSDFVSRYFGPNFGIPEDPVTGSAHCLSAPYWAEQLGKDSMTAIQLSTRVGHLGCRVSGDRVELTGQCVEYLKGVLTDFALPKA